MLGRILIAFAFLVSGSCFAQANVGDVSKLGAKKMTKEELVELHAGGVTLSGVLANGTPYSQRNKPDGTVDGSGGGGRFALSGTWKIDDSGKYCHVVQASGPGGLKFDVCRLIWKANDRYFFSADDAEATVVREVKFVK